MLWSDNNNNSDKQKSTQCCECTVFYKKGLENPCHAKTAESEFTLNI